MIKVNSVLKKNIILSFLRKGAARVAEPQESSNERQGKSTAFTPIGFTLAELLIALAILGVIATFTIPKILDSGSNTQRNAIAKETISIISGAYQQYKLQNTISATTTKGAITPYLNYVREVSNMSIDAWPTGGTYDCTNAARTCILFHNGSIIGYGHNLQMGSTDMTASLAYTIDADGELTNNQDSLIIHVYANERLTTYATVLPNTYDGTGGPYNPNPANDPPWFSWNN